jgi:predicted MPP superfamily phosphohydrolase
MRSARPKHNSRLRRMMMAALDSLLMRGSIASWSYRRGLHGMLRVTTHEIRTDKKEHLPRPLVLAFASDSHAGPSTHPEIFEVLVNELEARRPDVILLGGDYVSWKPEDVSVLCEQLSQCDPPLGTYGVLGNHDLWANEEHIKHRLTIEGVRVLVNENVALPHPFDGVSVCGMDDPWTGNADAALTFNGASPVRIFLTHSPDGLHFLEAEQFDVGFAGHTHGGQIALSDGTPIVTAGGPLSRAYGRGRFDVAGHGPFIVSRGVGCSNIPIRINSDPELVFCTLQPGG